MKRSKENVPWSIFLRHSLIRTPLYSLARDRLKRHPGKIVKLILLAKLATKKALRKNLKRHPKRGRSQMAESHKIRMRANQKMTVAHLLVGAAAVADHHLLRQVIHPPLQILNLHLALRSQRLKTKELLKEEQEGI
jgi:hypothetical protein